MTLIRWVNNFMDKVETIAQSTVIDADVLNGTRTMHATSEFFMTEAKIEGLSIFDKLLSRLTKVQYTNDK